MTTSEIAKDMKITRRRVQQVWKEYVATGKEPVVGKALGRPKKPFDERFLENTNDIDMRFHH
jgi:putative transposase